MEAREPVCPAAEPISGEHGPAVICGVKRHDAARADSILEGSPTGIVVEMATDPHTYVNWCTGTGEPGHPDSDPPPCHYTGCPIWAAGKEIDVAERIWRFEKPPTAEEAEARLREELGIEAGRETPGADELKSLFGFDDVEVRA